MPQGCITNFHEVIDVNNNFDPVTGVFTLKEDDEEGVYIFEVGAHKMGEYGMKGTIYVYKNDLVYHIIHQGDADNDSTMNSIFTLDLKKGDEVKLNNYEGDYSIYVSDSFPLIFTGYKV